MSKSRIPHSSQLGVHPSLGDVVSRHAINLWKQPVRRHAVEAFKTISQWVGQRLDSHDVIILDSGCGTGTSTAYLAHGCPNALVIGIDKSKARLARAPEMPPNACMLRAELSDMWRLVLRANWVIQSHYILYPNPWPKPGHLKRRWHGHPVFPDLVRLGGRLELRTNFGVYAEEFCAALGVLGVQGELSTIEVSGLQSISAFEQKYLDSGHQLFKVTADLG
jgi:tRNA G46 methylase TrmB